MSKSLSTRALLNTTHPADLDDYASHDDAESDVTSRAYVIAMLYAVLLPIVTVIGVVGNILTIVVMTR
jgi:hypothetical protein